jgi:hypothetical protein
MTTVTPMLSDSDFNVALALNDPDRGVRLAAYASLFATARSDLLQSLVHSVPNVDNKPFGQYWGIQAIGKVMQALDISKVPYSVVAELKRFLSTLQAGTDRHGALMAIIRQLDAPRTIGS